MTVTPTSFHVWEGVYASFAEAPAEGLGFADPTWRARSAAAAAEAQANLAAGLALDYSMRQRNSVLVVLAAALLARQSRVRILDFGGGLGFGYLVLRAALPAAAERIDYVIVEVEGVCEEGARTFAGAAGPTFVTELPATDEHVDIVFTASTLQYIDDWAALCRRLAAYRAPFLVLADVFAGPVESYATTQVYYGSRIPHWILDESEVTAAIAETGYLLQLRTPCNVRVLGNDGPLPMGNLPTQRRLEHSNHFLFSLPIT